MSYLQKFAIDLTSPYWWLSVVCVGVLINIASAYLKSPIDRIFEHWSLRRRAMNERRRAELETLSMLLANDIQLFNLEVSLQIRDFVLSVWLLAVAATLGLILFLLAPYHPSGSLPKFILSLVLAALAAILLLLSNVISQRAMNKLEVLALARRVLTARSEA